MPDLADPLEAYTGLSLFARTFASIPNQPQPHDSDDPYSIHNFLKSLPVRNPDKLIEQAKNVLDDTAEVPNAKMISDAAMENENDVVTEKALEFPRGQRPGLGRKRPRFSLLPNISQPTVNLEPTLDFDKLKDPEEFFSAYERLENAKKEIAKQTGRTFMDSDQYNVFKVPRSQRPGIPGRSIAKYKHLYPTMCSQENSEEDILPNCGSQQETTYPDVASQQTELVNVSSQQMELTNDASQQTKSANDASEEMELTGSLSKVENRVNELLDELLGHDFEELDEDRAVSLLQEQLRIKPLHVEKLNLPELQDIQRVDFRASGVNLPKPRNVLSDINNLLKVTRNITPIKLNSEECSVSTFGSPTPPKSPLASLSLLKKRVFQSNPSSDPFSVVDIEQSPVSNTYVESINKYSDPVDVENSLGISGKLDSTTEENDGPVVRKSSSEVANEDFTGLLDKDVNINLTSLGAGSEIGPRESCPLELEDNEVGMGNEVTNENFSCADADVDLQTNVPNEVDIVEDVQQEAVASAQPDKKSDDVPLQMSNSIQKELGNEHSTNLCPGIQDGASQKTEEAASERQKEKIQEAAVVSVNNRNQAKLRPRKRQHNKAVSKRQRQSFADSAIIEDQPMDGCLECQDNALDQTQDAGQEQTHITASGQHNEKIQEPSIASMDEQTKTKSHPSKENKRMTSSGRQSLAGCGMSWETGVRRSTRIRSRPLEYWRGERFLYGRIHNSMATIIGIKYESPGKDNRRSIMKVKSFVSDEYKDLVEQAALY